MDNPLIWQIVLQVILIMLNAVFACAEIAVISMNDNKLAQMVAKGDKRAIRLSHLVSQPAKFLATIQVAITLSGFLGSAFAADNFSDGLVQWIVGFGVPIPIKTLDTIAVVIITLILSYFTLVFGELVPKRVAMKKAESLALGMSAMITFISKLFAPIVWVLTASTNGMLRILGIDPSAEEEEVSEEEIRMLIDVGSEKGVIDKEEKEMLTNVLEFDNTTVGEFATHRKDISLLWLEETMEDWEQTIHETRHSFYPVCNESVDDVIGILDARDYFRLKEKTRDCVMNNGVKPAYFIPEGTCADVVFRKMKQTKNHFAVVLDEYGGMVGIVTMNDLLEQIVGELDGSYFDQQDKDLEVIDSKTWKIKGSASLEEVQEKLKVDLPVDSYDTFGGYIFGSYGMIPKDGSEFEVDTEELHIRVLGVKDHQVKKALVCLKEEKKIENENG